ncbi:MAG TPA: chemotaxis protein CheD, partial [Bacillota bacterium]
ADTAVPLLIREMEKMGVRRERLIVKIVGGAQMFCGNGYEDHICIGNKNIIAVETICQQLGLFISGRSVGGNSGKSVFLDLETGEVQVKTLTEYIKI